MKRVLGVSKIAFVCLAWCACWVLAQESAIQEVHGIQVQNMDSSVKPGDDFYQYANGNWLRRTEIPPDRAVITVFSRLDDLSNKRTADLIADGETGLLVQRERGVPCLAQALERLMADSSLRKKLGAEASNRMLAWRPDVVCQAWEAQLISVARA